MWEMKYWNYLFRFGWLKKLFFCVSSNIELGIGNLEIFRDAWLNIHRQLCKKESIVNLLRS